jgi:hypothetical protein
LTCLKGNVILTKVSEESLDTRVPEETGKLGVLKRFDAKPPKGVVDKKSGTW